MERLRASKKHGAIGFPHGTGKSLILASAAAKQKKDSATERRSDGHLQVAYIRVVVKTHSGNRSIMACANIDGCFSIDVLVDEQAVEKNTALSAAFVDGHSTYWNELCKISYGLSR
jgi:hypothetical protein